MTTIKIRKNGPYRVDGGDVVLVDCNGVRYSVDEYPFALCRCGASSNKPFCDGAHSKADFVAEETVPKIALDV